MNLERAMRKKYRFASVVGLLMLEQLWDLPLKSTREQVPDLDGVARKINSELKTQVEESFVETSTNVLKEELEEKLEIVKHIIAVRQEENKAMADAAERKRKKAALLDILHDRNNEELRKKTPAELEAMIAEL